MSVQKWWITLRNLFRRSTNDLNFQRCGPFDPVTAARVWAMIVYLKIMCTPHLHQTNMLILFLLKIISSRHETIGTSRALIDLQILSMCTALYSAEAIRATLIDNLWRTLGKSAWMGKKNLRKYHKENFLKSLLFLIFRNVTFMLAEQ